MMRLRLRQDHRTRIPGGDVASMKKGEVINVEDPLGEFLIADGRGIAFEVLTDDPAADSTDGADSTEDTKQEEPGDARWVELDAMTKEEIGKLILDKWLGLDGIGSRSTKAAMIDAVLAREGADARGDADAITTEPPATEGESLVIGRDADGADMSALHMTKTVDGEAEETWAAVDGSPLSDDQQEALDVFLWPIDGLDGLAPSEDGEIVSLRGGVADGRMALVDGLADSTLRTWLAEIDSEMQLDDLDRDGLLETIRDLQE